MITILHGDNIEASRAALSQFKDKADGRERRIVNGAQVDVADITQAVESASLFGGSTLIVLENIFGKLGKKPKKIEEIAAILVRAGKTEDIIIWEDKELGKTVLGQFGPSARVTLYKVPVLVFQFLDSLRPGNAGMTLKLYAEMIKSEAPELALIMVQKRVRQLLMIAGHVNPPGMQSWQIGRLTTQAKLFTIEKLQSMYTELFDLEFNFKSGNTSFPLAVLIEQFIIEL